jgi:hypothetical protein
MVAKRHDLAGPVAPSSSFKCRGDVRPAQANFDPIGRDGWSNDAVLPARIASIQLRERAIMELVEVARRRREDRPQYVGFESPDAQDPAQLPRQIAVFASRQDLSQLLSPLILHILLSFQEAYFLANLRGLPVSCSKRFVAETVARAISAAAVYENLSGAISWLTFFAGVAADVRREIENYLAAREQKCGGL